MLPMYSHHAFNEKQLWQVNASQPLKKNLWQQTVMAKITNQAALLNQHNIKTDNMETWASSVKSGDADNHEARAAAYYWANIFNDFKRHRFGSPPNNMLNYGYAILRSVIARGLVSRVS